MTFYASVSSAFFFQFNVSLHFSVPLVIFYQISLAISWFPRSENITVTRGEDVHFRCPLSSNISTKDYIIQWKKARNSDDHLVVSINGKIPKSLSTLYRTEFTDQTSSLQVFHVDRADSTTYICETFETQTILCQYNLVVLSK